MVGTLLLSLTTCLSMGTGTFVEGQSLERIKTQTKEMLEIGADELNPNNFNLSGAWTESRINNDIELVLLETIPYYGMVSDELLPYFKKEASNLTENSTFTTDFSKADIFSSSLFVPEVGETTPVAIAYVNSLIATPHYEKQTQLESGGGTITEVDISTAGTSYEKESEDTAADIKQNETDVPQIGLISNHDDTKLEVNSNVSLSTGTLFGFDFPADTCISMYNIISNKLNMMAATSQIDKKSLWNNIVTLLNSYAPDIALLTTYIVTLFSDVWDTLFAFLQSTGALGVIISIILAIVAVATITVLVKIYICGKEQKGWRVGLLCHNIFSWEWINEEY